MFDNKYPYTDFHELNLDWFLEQFKEYESKIITQDGKIATMDETVEQFTTFVTNYFNNLDVQTEINNKLDAMAASGELQALLQPYFDHFVETVNDQIMTQNNRIENLQAQINEIVAPDPDPSLAEVATARVNANGVTYPTLKARCDGDYNDLNGKITILEDTTLESRNQVVDIVPENTWEVGYYRTNDTKTSNASYCVSELISVSPGDVVESIRGGVPKNMRYIEAYNNGVYVADKSTTADSTAYTVPDGVTAIYVTIYSAHYTTEVLHIQRTNTLYNPAQKRTKNSLSAETATLAANTELTLTEHLDNKKNCAYQFFGKFSVFGELTIAHGTSEYGAVYLIIDNTNIVIYSHTGSIFSTTPHELTLTDFIDVYIKVADTYNARATIILRTNGGTFTTDNKIFFGSNGAVFAKSTIQMSDVKFTYSIEDMRKDVYIFGDSYISLADDARWPKKAIQQNCNNMLLCGFGGATSLDEIVSFRNITDINYPKYIAWFLGMNDPDNGAINANWKSYVDEVIDFCENHNIELILATIPNTPIMDNTYKNAYVKSSGLRYVDFARAVGAETANSSWYTGMLSGDQVHPTEAGANALCSRVTLDIPEIIQ